MAHTVRTFAIDHMTLPVGDLEASLRFYRAVLVDGLGWPEVVSDGLPSFGPPGSDDLQISAGGPLGAPLHLAFVAATREAMERFHACGLQAGGRDNGAPGPRPQYSHGYHGAFLLDPDGHNVEAVWRPE